MDNNHLISVLLDATNAKSSSEFLFIAMRTVAIYLFIITAIRISGKKELAQLSVVDLVFIMLISNSVQNAMVGEMNDFYIGLVSASALFILNYVIKIIFFKNRKISNLILGSPVMLIHKGVVITEHLKSERISLEELETAAREHGEEDLKKVDLAVLETDGSISIMSKDFHHQTNRKRKHSKELPSSTSN